MQRHTGSKRHRVWQSADLLRLALLVGSGTLLLGNPVQAETGVRPHHASRPAACDTPTKKAKISKPVLSPRIALYLFDARAGETWEGKVALSGNAPTGGTVVTLHSSNPALTVPPTITIPAGAKEASFPVKANAVFTPVTVDVTAMANGIRDTDSVNVVFAISLSVAETGSGKNTLYWNGVADAVGYDIYRSRVPGRHYTKCNATPIAPRDPGLTNAFMYSDTGLKNGTEYFYCVVAVGATGAREFRSNEDSGIPDPNATPWDTGDAERIMASMKSVAAVSNPIGKGQPDLIIVGGPNGVVYQTDVFTGKAVASAPPPDDGLEPPGRRLIRIQPTPPPPLDTAGFRRAMRRNAGQYTPLPWPCLPLLTLREAALFFNDD